MTAVGTIEFAVEPGEVVGFLGPNGAGKTTTLKMPSGLLHRPPAARRCSASSRGARARLPAPHDAGMGQRNQLVWDIPVADSFERNRAIYRIDAARFKRVVAS